MAAWAARRMGYRRGRARITAMTSPAKQGETFRTPSVSTAGATPLEWRVSTARATDYEVRVAEPLLDPANAALLEGGHVPGRRFVVVDDGVPPERRGDLEAYFDARGVSIGLLLVNGGERFKTIDNVLKVANAFAQFGLDRRNEPVVVVGGGAVLDTVSLAASLYRRGVPFVRVPTTLLAYVDA